MSKNHKMWEKLLPCLALATAMVLVIAISLPTHAFSQSQATIQISTGNHFNVAYEKTLGFIQPLLKKIEHFTDQPKSWNEISKDIVTYAKEKPLMAIAAGAGIIWIPFGLLRAFRSKNEENVGNEFEHEKEADEEYQKSLNKINENVLESDDDYDNSEAVFQEVIKQATPLEETKDAVSESSESKSLENSEDDFAVFKEDEDNDIFFEEEEDEENDIFFEEEEDEENDDFSKIFSESNSNNTESSDSDSLKKLFPGTDDEFDAPKNLQSEPSAVDGFINQTNEIDETDTPKDEVSFLSREDISDKNENLLQIDKLFSNSESPSNLENLSPKKGIENDLSESEEPTSNAMEVINNETPVPSSQNIDIKDLEGEEQLDQTLKDLQSEMEETIQEISSRIDSGSQEENVTNNLTSQSTSNLNKQDTDNVENQEELEANEQASTRENSDDEATTKTKLSELIEDSLDSFDPLLSALDSTTHEETTPKLEDKQIDSVKANSYIKSLATFQKNLENRLNSLKYFPPEEDKKPPKLKADEFENEELFISEKLKIDFDHIGESPEKKYSLELMESFIFLDSQK